MKSFAESPSSVQYGLEPSRGGMWSRSTQLRTTAIRADGTPFSASLVARAI
jgi:hypothetical protein